MFRWVVLPRSFQYLVSPHFHLEMPLRTTIENILSSILPNDLPPADRSRGLTDTGSLDEDTNKSDSRTTEDAPPSYSSLPPSNLPPSYSDLFPSPSPPPSPIPVSVPTQTWRSTSSSFSRPRPTGPPIRAASTGPGHTIGPPFKPKYLDKSISILFRLPDKLLGLVIKELDNPGIECLRRVSRRFNAFCNDEILTRPYTFQPGWQLSDHGGPFVWPRFRAFNGPHAWPHIAPGERQHFLRLITKDMYCDGCRRARDAEDWERRVERLVRYLYCHSCKADHPACLFPASQRQVPASHRSCIAHEGYFRLCQHDEGIVRWSDISRIMKQSKDGGHEVDCRIRCDDDSHLVPCAETSRERSDRRGWNTFCAEWPIPQLEVVNSRIWLRWTAHMPFQTNGGPFAEHELRLRIAEVRKKGRHFLYPTMTFEQDVPEMCCFDPNDCGCVPFERPSNIGSEPESLMKSGKVCRTNFSRKLPECAPDESSLRSPSAASNIWEQLRPHKSKSRGACESSKKRHTARWYYFGSAQVQVACWPCNFGDSCLVLNYIRALTVGRNGAIDAEWYQALDPESYNLTDDKEGFEVYWCRQEQCRNYLGRVPCFSRIVGSKEYYRPA